MCFHLPVVGNPTCSQQLREMNPRNLHNVLGTCKQIIFLAFIKLVAGWRHLYSFMFLYISMLLVLTVSSSLLILSSECSLFLSNLNKQRRSYISSISSNAFRFEI
jgi:hypothetical protein